MHKSSTKKIRFKKTENEIIEDIETNFENIRYRRKNKISRYSRKYSQYLKSSTITQTGNLTREQELELQTQFLKSRR